MKAQPLTALLALTLIALPAVTAAAAVEPSYLYNLSSSTGVIPFSAVRLSYDDEHHELFVMGAGLIRIFNDSGMELYAFGDDPGLGGAPIWAAPMAGGDLMLLAYDAEHRPFLARCDYRGELIERSQLTGFPPELATGFSPNYLAVVGDKVYLASLGEMRVAVTDLQGQYRSSRDLAEAIEVADKREDFGIAGFRVDRRGNMLFTVQPLFKAFVITAQGEVRSFGIKGSAPGKFNVVSGIASDDRGNFYVTDILKSAVLVFNDKLEFVKEFGYRGRSPGSLAAPCDVIAGNGKLFVAQNAKRGVNVYQLLYPN